MKKLSCSILLLVMSMAAIAQSQCDKCILPRISLFDAGIQIPKPEGKEYAWEYSQLPWPAKFANSYLFNNDPSHSCWVFIDKSFLEGKASTANQPVPAGDMTGDGKLISEELSFFITSTVTGTIDNSKMVMEIRSACDRKTVARSEVSFSGKDKPDALEKAGEQAASQLMPMNEKIMSYARELRETNTSYMLSGRGAELKIKPAKTKLAVGEETEVDIQLTDCDSYLLKNRKVSFVKGSLNGLTLNGTEGGIVTSSTVTTDAQGKAKVKFKLTRPDGTAMIYAHFSGFNPSGCADVVFGSAPIGNIPVKIELDYMYHESGLAVADAKLLYQAQTHLQLHRYAYKRHTMRLLYYPRQALKEDFSIEIPAAQGEPAAKVKYLQDDGVYMTRDNATGNLAALAINGSMDPADYKERLRTGNADPDKHTRIKLDWNGSDLAELQIEFVYKPKGNDYLNDPVPDTYFFRSTKDAGFVKNKIADKNSPYKSEYIITLNRVDKLNENNALNTVMSFGARISEKIVLKVLTPYE